MGDDGEPLKGDVEIDETSWGGKPRKPHGQHAYLAAGPSRQGQRPADSNKTTVLGMVERGGRIRFRVIASRHGATLSRAVTANVNPDSIIFTDDWGSYKPLARRLHRPQGRQPLRWRVRARRRICTNTIEGAFGNMKTGMRGVYKKVSPAYLQNYLDEYAWRHNAKREGHALFTQLLDRAVEGKPAAE